MDVGEAYTMRAGRSPMRTAGRCAPSTAKPVPSMEMRPPSMAAGGRTAVTRGEPMRWQMRNRMDHRPAGAGLRLVELGVPVQVIAPALRRPVNAYGDADRRRRL